MKKKTAGDRLEQILSLRSDMVDGCAALDSQIDLLQGQLSECKMRKEEAATMITQIDELIDSLRKEIGLKKAVAITDKHEAETCDEITKWYKENNPNAKVSRL